MKTAALGMGLVVAIALGGAAEAKKTAYAAGVDVQSVSGSGCLDTSNSAFAGVLQFDGLSGTTTALRIPLPQLAVVSTQILTTKSGGGTSRPSGTFTWNGIGPSGTLWNVSGNFQASITTVDEDSYVFAITETYGNCNESSYISATSLKPK